MSLASRKIKLSGVARRRCEKRKKKWPGIHNESMENELEGSINILSSSKMAMLKHNSDVLIELSQGKKLYINEEGIRDTHIQCNVHTYPSQVSLLDHQPHRCIACHHPN